MLSVLISKLMISLGRHRPLLHLLATKIEGTLLLVWLSLLLWQCLLLNTCQVPKRPYLEGILLRSLIEILTYIEALR